jgi:ferric-dicitrate binding protein FerR (iron transport regulator)
LRVELGDEIATIGAAEGSLELLGGVAIGLGSDTLVRLTTAPAGEVSVDAGSVSVKVPKLPQGQTFAIRTPNARVSVHGTEFSVGVQSAAVGGVATHVVVTSGVVTVECDDGKNATLTAGKEEVCALPVSREEPSAAATTDEASPTPESVAPVAAGPKSRAEGTARSSPSGTGAPIERDGLLGEQNRLLASAMDARKRGDDQGAVRILDDFLAKYPSSPVVEVAHVERFRALERAGNHAEASKEARRYLATFRDGFAREEARRLAVGRL